MADKAPLFCLPQVAVKVYPPSPGLALPWRTALRAASLTRGRLDDVPWGREQGFAADLDKNGTDRHFATSILNETFLDKVLKVLERPSTCYVLGTCSFDRAVKLSWEAYGLNLFDLPWGADAEPKNTKAIRYVPLRRLADLLYEADRHVRLREREQLEERQILLIARAASEIGWARCRIRLRNLGKSVCHGSRDALQMRESPPTAVDIGDFTPQCPALDNYVCPIPEILGSLRGQFAGGAEPWWPVRELANLDCQARMFAPSAARMEGKQACVSQDLANRCSLPMASYRRIVIVEDKEAVRRDIGRRFLPKYDDSAKSARLFEEPVPPEGSLDSDPVVISQRLQDAFRQQGEFLPATTLLYSVKQDAPLCRLRLRPDFVACWRHERDAWLLLDGDTSSGRNDQEYLLVQNEDKASWSVYRQPLAFADPDKTIKTGVPTRADGTKINVPAVHDHCPGAGTLFCFDLELRSQAESRDSDQTPDGVRVLYKTALEFPYSSRVVVTGYRHQDHVAFNAGTGTFLLKPFTDHEFDKAVEHALPFRAVWVCPEKVRENWRRYWPTANSGEGGDAIFESHIWAPLHDWAAQRGIFLAKPVEDRKAAAVQTASIVFLDLFEMPDGADWPNAKKLADDLRDELVEVKTVNPSAQVVTLLPMTDAIFVNGGALETQGRLARDGQDFVAFKPLPLFTDCPSVPSIGQSLLSALAARPWFDVKYVTITPLMGLVWAKCKDPFLKACEHGSNDPKDWGPFVVFAGQKWGMQVPVRSLTGNPNLGLDLLEEFERERENNRQRWQGRPSSPVDSCRRFVEFLRRFDEYWTAETWLFSILNEKSFTEELDRLFGGETRLGLGTRGAWYDGSQRVEDPNLVVEFCGRRGIIGREAIRKWVVNYLKGQGAEQVVLFHEVPMRGYLE